jgi:hypothetical protein
MEKIFKALKPTYIVLFFMTAFFACDKDFTTIESDVIGEDNANFADSSISLPIIAYNKTLDSIQISNLAATLFGIYQDPTYGKSTANIVTQIIPSTFNPDFGTNAAIDSVILKIPYFSRATGIDDTTGNTVYSISDSIYGDESSAIKLSIFQNKYFLRDINPTPGSDGFQKYYSSANNPDNISLTESGSIKNSDIQGDLIYTTDDFTPSNEIIILTEGIGDDKTSEAFAPSLRVKLDSLYWTNTILDKGGSAHLSNPNNFKNYFRGLHFKAESADGEEGHMILLNLDNSASNITIYYSKDSATAGEKEQASYTLNFTGNKLNTFINEFSVAIPIADKALGNEKIYLKNVGSMAVVDLFPNEADLEDLRDQLSNADGTQNSIIREAQLIIYEDESMTSSEDYHKYDRIYAYDVKNNTPIIDYAFDQTDNTNSPYNSKFIHLGQRMEEGDDSGIWKYKIRITEHLNRLVFQDSTNTKIGLVLSNNVNYTNNAVILNSGDDVTAVPAASIIAPRGTILHGSHASLPDTKRMSLKLFFTKPK